MKLVSTFAALCAALGLLLAPCFSPAVHADAQSDGGVLVGDFHNYGVCTVTRYLKYKYTGLPDEKPTFDTTADATASPGDPDMSISGTTYAEVWNRTGSEVTTGNLYLVLTASGMQSDHSGAAAASSISMGGASVSGPLTVNGVLEKGYTHNTNYSMFGGQTLPSGTNNSKQSIGGSFTASAKGGAI